MPGTARDVGGDLGRAALRSLLARLRDSRQTAAAAQAIEDAECKLFLDEYASYYANLRETDPEEWAAVQEERRAFDGTLMDGLADE